MQEPIKLDVVVVTGGSYSARDFRFQAHTESGPLYLLTLTPAAAETLFTMLRAWSSDHGRGA